MKTSLLSLSGTLFFCTHIQLSFFFLSFFFCLSTTSRITSQSKRFHALIEKASAAVTITRSACPLLFIGGVFVQVDVGDNVDLSDLTSHQVEQSFAKHDLKCAGPRANAAVTLASPSCHLSERPMRADSCSVPKTNHCCVW